MKEQVWMARRVATALALMVGFYALALGVVVGLLWLAYADVMYTTTPTWKLVGFCVIGAGSVLWAIVPRPDRFEAPGPQLKRSDEPELFNVIDEIAVATNQAPPTDVYVVQEVNAFVTQRGGIMGFGSHRVMGLGLPLMRVLTVDEFKSVVAHEFGHYHAGDVALGPWIYKTRSAIGRTIAQLDENVLQKIFLAYGQLFLRVTHGVSRHQEFVADRLAAELTGASRLVSGLRKLAAASFAYSLYWQHELQPVMAAGYVPPVMDGFGRYIQNDRLTAITTTLVEAQEAEGHTDLYDTHPSLRDRIAALETVPSRPAADDRAATSLLSNPFDTERRVLQTLGPDIRDLKPIGWDRVGEAVYLPMWRAQLTKSGRALPECSIGDFPATKAALIEIGRSALLHKPEATEEECSERAWQLVIAAIGIALTQIGWSADALPGEEVVFRSADRQLRVWSELSAMIDDEGSSNAWVARCRALGIQDVALART